jgi:hypothetical protein
MGGVDSRMALRHGYCPSLGVSVLASLLVSGYVDVKAPSGVYGGALVITLSAWWWSRRLPTNARQAN